MVRLVFLCWFRIKNEPALRVIPGPGNIRRRVDAPGTPARGPRLALPLLERTTREISRGQSGGPMPRKILVPLDGSALAESILAHVRRFVRREYAAVTLLRAVPEHAIADAPRGKNLLALAESETFAVRDRLRSQGAPVDALVVSGDPATRILEVSEEVGASLIAMSTHGRSGLERFVRGSVCERVLRGSNVPVLVANPRVTGPVDEVRLQRILVPIDASELSASVIPLAVGLARLYDAEILLLHAVDLSAFHYPEVIVPHLQEDAEKLLDRRRRSIEGVPVRLRLVQGRAAEKILDVAAEEKVDLVTMTTHGYSGLTRWSYGSVAEQVVRHGTCPLLVQRMPGGANG
jgi:nucleotide-binding universal stress UspA family protein